jgi:transcriptional regulator with XRE-family HTH domain
LTPAEKLRTARKTLGLTQHGLADALRMGKWGFQSVAKWERGETAIPGPAQVAVELLVEQSQWVSIPRMHLGKAK